MPNKFEAIFTKYDEEGKAGMTFWQGLHMLYRNRCIADGAGESLRFEHFPYRQSDNLCDEQALWLLLSSMLCLGLILCFFFLHSNSTRVNVACFSQMDHHICTLLA